jgi:four helix bundle protein
VAIYDVRDLAAYQRCEQLMMAVEAATAQPAARRDFHFCDRINDSALDAASDVSEGFVRYYPADFAHFLNYALASLAEVRRRVETGYRRGYFPARPRATCSSCVSRPTKLSVACGHTSGR